MRNKTAEIGRFNCFGNKLKSPGIIYACQVCRLQLEPTGWKNLGCQERYLNAGKQKVAEETEDNYSTSQVQGR